MTENIDVEVIVKRIPIEFLNLFLFFCLHNHHQSSEKVSKNYKKIKERNKEKIEHDVQRSKLHEIT